MRARWQARWEKHEVGGRARRSRSPRRVPGVPRQALQRNDQYIAARNLQN